MIFRDMPGAAFKSINLLKINILVFKLPLFNFYKKRPHSSLNSKTPWQKLKSVEHLIPIQPNVTNQFWDSEEEIQPRNYEYFKRFKYKKADPIAKMINSQVVPRKCV